jgi:argininosuccinate lyase
MDTKLWGGRFTKTTHHSVDEFNASITFDNLLAKYDIQGSIAHARMLAKCNILTASEAETIVKGLQHIATKISRGEVQFDIKDEDIHMNVERLLQQEIGALAGKLHTGRSRNDQVALDLHLYVREQIVQTIEKLFDLQNVLVEKAEKHIDTVLPGYTHLQRAQPVRLAHHWLAYVAMLQRDVSRLQDSYERVNISPLGAGALAGAGFNLDRDFVAEELKFAGIYANSMDAVSDRDFVVEYLANASLIMTHLSRLSEELIIWTSREFSFIEFDDAFSTGSSMMPQKKNPDVAELVRGKTGRVYGALMGMLTVLKGLPLAYNKDMQEDKEGLFDTVKTVQNCLKLYAPMMMTLKVNEQSMHNAAQNDFINATELADYLVKQGVTFRDAHEISGKLVLYCLQNNCFLMDLPLAKLQEYSEVFRDDIFQALRIEHAVEARRVRGGTAKAAVEEQFRIVRKQLESTQEWIHAHAEFWGEPHKDFI